MKTAPQTPRSGLAARLRSILAIGWMLLVLGGFLVIRVVGSQSFQALHLFGRAH